MPQEDAFAWHLRIYHKLKPEDVEPVSTPGYWRIKEPCGGRSDGCHNALHWGIGSDGPVRHTVTFRDSHRDPKSGRFVSPFRTWKKNREGDECESARASRTSPS